MFLIDIITEPLETIASYIHDSYPDTYFYRKKRWFSVDNTRRSKDAIGFMIEIANKLKDDIRIEFEHSTGDPFNNSFLKESPTVQDKNIRSFLKHINTKTYALKLERVLRTLYAKPGGVQDILPILQQEYVFTNIPTDHVSVRSLSYHLIHDFCLDVSPKQIQAVLETLLTLKPNTESQYFGKVWLGIKDLKD